MDPKDQRESIYQPGNRLDCAIVSIDYDKNRVVLSVKEKEKIENAEAVKKYGKEGKSSGQSLKGIFEKVLGSKTKKSTKKEKK